MGKQQSNERDGRDAEGGLSAGFNAGDEGQVGERKVNAKNAERERIAGFGQLLETKQGRAWAWWLLGQCGVFRTSFTGNSTTFFNEGKRDIGLLLLGDITREFPDAYMTMTKENANG